MEEHLNGSGSAPSQAGALPAAGPAQAPRGARTADYSAAQLAKATLRRLVAAQDEPTPDNYARAWAQEAGTAASVVAAASITTAQWATLIERVLRSVERGSQQWTTARKKDCLQRVLDSSRSDSHRLHDRLGQLVSSWDSDSGRGVHTQPGHFTEAASDDGQWAAVVGNLLGTLRTALPADEAHANELSDQLATLARRIDTQGVSTAVVVEVRATSTAAQRVLAHRHQLIGQLAALVRELTGGLTDLAEDESWARGQAEAIHARLGGDDGGQTLSARSVRATQELLAQTRQQQRGLKGERDRARDALKTLVQNVVSELGELQGRTGRFGDQLGGYAESIEQADSLDGLTTLVRDMVQQSRAVQADVTDASTRLQSGQAVAEALSQRVRELEGELRRMSEEISIDALTQVANRRGLAKAFEVEAARHARDGSTLSVALIDIDNFKKLNDSLGHTVGDEALKTLAARVRAGFGGEEFVVLLPATDVVQAQEALTRLQRDLTTGLFMHEGRDVFVTFSGGVTAWRIGEAIDAAIERADEALYEAKRSGKNRTCLA
jgi:diguanylate cyclase